MASNAPIRFEEALVIERVFDAPRALVWRALTESEMVKQWLGPKEFAALEFTLNRTPGGRWHGRMRGPDGHEHANGGVVREVIEPEFLAYTFAWDEADGQPGREMFVTIVLEERDGKTAMRFTQAEFESREDRDGHRDGWSQSFDKLAAYLNTLPV